MDQDKQEKQHDLLLLKLQKDILAAAAALTPRDARYVVDLYYQTQSYRIAIAGQIRSGDDEPHAALGFVLQQMETIERQLQRVLDAWTIDHRPSQWARSICGIGPVLAAGLRAYIDITKCPTVGHVWRYAGLDPSRKWQSKDNAAGLVKDALARCDIQTAVAEVARIINCSPESLYHMATHKLGKPIKLTATSLAHAAARRPWNAGLKVLTWKIGESFIKVQANESDVYGQIYAARKRLEIERNDANLFADQAKQKLEQFRIGKDTDAYKAYSIGKLPPAHVHARARRYAVKLFLSHYWETAYRDHFGVAPPLPYPIAFKGHAHQIPVPSQLMGENQKQRASHVSEEHHAW